MEPAIQNQLLFSEKRRYRVKRHLLYWFIYWLYFGLLHAANSFGSAEIMYFNNLPFTLTESILMLLPQVLLAYPMLYFILPNFFLKSKYIAGFLLTAFLWFCVACLSLFMFQDLNQKILPLLLPDHLLRFQPRHENATFFMSLLLVMKGGLLAVSTAVLLKLLKYWYLKEHYNMQLKKENAESQLRLLTAQVHPHFLFNTLNNIFSQTQTESPKGSQMILSLSDMLRYILYEGQKPLVPLKQELQMIKEYIDLEKIRYGNKLELHVELPEVKEPVYIAPLLLLPFVENCFKHGTSHVLQNPWINLTIELKEAVLYMKLMNGTTTVNKHQQKGGIGIVNVKQRLSLLYKDQHQLQIIEDGSVFIVNLQIALVIKELAKDKKQIVQNQPSINYV